MKTHIFNVFNTHLCAFVCTFFFFLNFAFSAKAQTCPPGLTVSIAFEIENQTVGSPIPFCTPIILTTTVQNTSNTSQVTDLRTTFSNEYEIVCLGDYAAAADCSDTNLTGFCLSKVSIPANGQQTFRITVRYNTQRSSFGVNNAVSTLGIISNNCLSSVAMPSYVALTTKVIGIEGQTTTVTAIPAASGSGPIVVRGNVRLDLDYTVTNDAANNGFIGMEDYAALIIPSGRTLTLRGAYLFGCKSMWNSIIVESGGTLVTSNDPATNNRNTIIEDGEAAIEARQDATITVSQTVFRDNQRSVFVAPSTTGMPQDINFSSFIGCQFEGTGTMKQVGSFCGRVNRHPFAGIDVNDVSYIQLISAPPVPRTRFVRMSNGILARSTHLFVNRVTFEEIKSTYSGFDGLGIWSHHPNSLLLVAGDFNSTQLNFSNCTQAVVYENFGAGDLAQINSLNIDNTADAVGIGIKAINNNFSRSFIYDNDIRAKTGIISGWNRFDASNVGEMYNNVIDPTNPSSPSVSLGIVSYDNSITGNWNIRDNFINVQNAQGGMQFNAGAGAIIINNTVALESASHVNAYGIQANGSSNLAASCNNILGNGIANSTYRSGMFISGGTGSSYTCNNLGDMEVGFNIVGQCTPFTMTTNQFNNHSVGLVLNNASVIGTQSLQGNIWQGPFTRWGAEHNDPNQTNVQLSKFTVGSLNSPIMPTFSAADPEWFKFISGTDPLCSSLNTCGIGTSPNRVAGGGSTDEAFYTSAISEARIQTPNAEEMKWTAQRNAYGRLMDNPSHQNNRDKTNFVGRMRNASTGQLYQVEKGIKDVQNIGQEFGDALRANTNAIKALAIEMADLDTKIFTARGAEKTALMARKKEKNADIHRLSTENAPRHATIERKRNQEIQRLMRENERISTNLQPEINEKEVNTIYLATVAQGKMELNSEQKATVRLIAYQCPSLGGNAVFAARSLYSLVEHVKFDDLALCSARSEAIQELVAKRVETNYKISPNPATDILSVSQSSEKSEAGEWLIFHTAGKLLLSKKVMENEMQVNINIQGLSEGIYFVSFVVNREKRFNQKIIKIKSN